MGFDISVEISRFMKIFEPRDDLRQDLSGSIKGEDHVIIFIDSRLVLKEISSFAIFEDKVDILAVFLAFDEFEDVGRIQLFHALDFPFNVLSHALFFLNLFEGHDLQGIFLAILILNEVHVSIGSLAQLFLAGVLVEIHLFITVVLKSSIYIFNKIKVRF